MRNDPRTIEEQILGGILITLWLLSRPLVWTYYLLKWFVVSVFKETGNRLVKVTGGAVAASMAALVAQYFIN